MYRHAVIHLYTYTCTCTHITLEISLYTNTTIYTDMRIHVNANILVCAFQSISNHAYIINIRRYLSLCTKAYSHSVLDSSMPQIRSYPQNKMYTRSAVELITRQQSTKLDESSESVLKGHSFIVNISWHHYYIQVI